jgi:MOSC domain-containing protein YiiM
VAQPLSPGPGAVLARIDSVQVGRPQWVALPASDRRGVWSAIAKSQRTEPVAVHATHLEGDVQADTVHHGGADKAVHAHFAQHLAWWGERRGWPLAPGEVGENLTLGPPDGGEAPAETTFCLGDVLQAGSAVLQVTQPRIPCFKQAAVLRLPEGLAAIARSGRTGMYLRVLQPGTLQAGDCLRLLARPNAAGATVALANRFIHGERDDPELLALLRSCRGLGAELRRLLERSTV